MGGRLWPSSNEGYCWLLNVAIVMYQTGPNTILSSGLLACIRTCLVFYPYTMTRDCSTMKILIPYRYITQCTNKVSGTPCLFSGLEVIGEQSWYAVPESSKAPIKRCGSRGKISATYYRMRVVYIFTWPRLLFRGYRGSLSGGKAAGELSLKNVWSYTLLSPVFMEWTGRTQAILPIFTLWHRKCICCTVAHETVAPRAAGMLGD